MAGLTAAEQVLADLGIADPSDIDVEAIAWTLGARVRYRPLDGCEARILGSGDRAIITVNSRSHPRRQRFSVAHELGHWRFHRGRLLVCHADDIGGAGDARPMSERTADNYAAQLLMPAYLFDPIARSHSKLTFQTVRIIADIFDTSLTATAIRMVDSRHSPAVLVCHGPQGRKWFARSPDVPDRWFPRDNLDSESFAFGILFGRAQEDRTPRKIGADAWFDRWGPKGSRYLSRPSGPRLMKSSLSSSSPMARCSTTSSAAGDRRDGGDRRDDSPLGGAAASAEWFQSGAGPILFAMKVFLSSLITGMEPIRAAAPRGRPDPRA